MSVESHVTLAPYTTFKTGGPAEYFAEVSTTAALTEALQFARAKSLSVRILGEGSNVLVADAGVAGLVLRVRNAEITHTDAEAAVLLTVGAGMNWDALVAYTVEHGWWGLENLSHIPGTVGATPVQNVGAYGVEVGDVIESVTAYDTTTDTLVTLSTADCEFAYRDSLFKRLPSRYVITEVTFRLVTSPQPQLTYTDLSKRFAGTEPTLADIRSAVIAIRAQKFPDWSVVGTAGSFFKNPIVARQAGEALLARYPTLPHFVLPDGRMKLSLAWIIDTICDLRGARVGDVGTYEGQALVLVNYGNATTADIVAFGEMIARSVKEKTGIKIEREVTYWE